MDDFIHWVDKHPIVGFILFLWGLTITTLVVLLCIYLSINGYAFAVIPAVVLGPILVVLGLYKWKN